MSQRLKSVSEIVAKANDRLYAKHSDIDTLMGMMDSVLRKQGIAADAVTVDCVVRDKKLVFLLHDEAPDLITVALGNKEGDIHSSSEYALDSLTEDVVLQLMEMHFI